MEASMDDTAAGGALTEIALAVAMAFFSILILTLVSVGNPAASDGRAAPRLEIAGGADAEGADTRGRPVAADETLIVFHGGRYLDREGRVTDPRALADGPVVLAVDPGLSVDRVLAARAAVGRHAVTVTTLDPAWVRRLGGPEREGGDRR